MPDRVLERMPDRMPQKMSEQMPESMAVRIDVRYNGSIDYENRMSANICHIYFQIRCQKL